MKSKIQGLLVVLLFLVSSSALALSISDVGDVDQLTNYKWNSSNSGDDTEAGYFAELLGVDTSSIKITKFETEDGAGWTEIDDRDTTWAYDFGNLSPGYFLIKTGNKTALASNPSSEYDTYMFENLADLKYAVVDLSLFVKTVGNMGIIDISRFSHISISNSVPVPEPSILLLLGAGVAGLAVYRRRKN